MFIFPHQCCSSPPWATVFQERFYFFFCHAVFPVCSLPCFYFVSLDFMTVYFQIRSVQLDRSIKGLKDHFRKNSSSTGVPYSPAIQNKRKDTPTKKPIKRPGESLIGDLCTFYHLTWVFDTLVQDLLLLK